MKILSTRISGDGRYITIMKLKYRPMYFNISNIIIIQNQEMLLWLLIIRKKNLIYTTLTLF